MNSDSQLRTGTNASHRSAWPSPFFSHTNEHPHKQKHGEVVWKPNIREKHTKMKPRETLKILLFLLLLHTDHGVNQ